MSQKVNNPISMHVDEAPAGVPKKSKRAIKQNSKAQHQKDAALAGLDSEALAQQIMTFKYMLRFNDLTLEGMRTLVTRSSAAATQALQEHAPRSTLERLS